MAVAGNSVFSAEPGADRTPVELRLVTPSQIDSIAFPAQTAAGLYLQGFAVTPGGVLRITAETSTRWLTEPVALPNTLVPREVWFEGNRGRVGFADGTVYSLPSRVPIAAALPNGVIDFAQACGQQLALGPTGLHRLESGTGSIGAWKPLTLPVGFADAGFANGRVHGVGKSVYVFTRTGEAARLHFAGCP